MRNDLGTSAKLETIISSNKGNAQYWYECWRFRELVLLLVWRDFLVRYKQTVFGVTWAIIRPFVTMIVFTFIFGSIAKLPSPGTPYPLLVFAAVLPWQYFASTFPDAGNSMVANANMVSKVYFPRLIVPASVVFAGLIDMFFSGVILVGLALWYSYLPGWQLIFLPAFLLLLCLFVFSCSVWVAALNVNYRDFRYVIPFTIQLGAYISPVGFSSSVIPEKWHLLYALNPMVGIIEGFRWCILRGQVPLDFVAVQISLLVTAVLLITGLRFFIRSEKTFADVI